MTSMAGLVANVATPEDAARTVGKSIEMWGQLDVLANNAGAGVSKDIHSGLLDRFIQAAQCGDDVTLTALLADDVTIISNGGGKAPSFTARIAARVPDGRHQR